MPKKKLPEGATALWRWMTERRVTVEELATLVGCTPQYLSDVRRGVKRPSDQLKLAIAEHTIAIEKKQGVARPKGVVATSWYEKSEASA